MAALTVWKYRLRPSEPGEPLKVTMPAGLRLLSVAVQGDAVSVWALVDPDAPLVQRDFLVVGTGWAIELPSSNHHELEFVGTAIAPNGNVFHVLEVVEVVF